MIVSPGVRRLDRVLDHRVERADEALLVGLQRARQLDVGDEVALRGRRPALHRRVEQRVEADSPYAGELRVVGGCEREQAVRDAGEPLELADDHVGVRTRLPLGAGDQQLGVPARDGDRRPQQVRGVADELALALGGAPRLLERHVAPVGVPHHREEHREHERDLGELVEPVAGDLHGAQQRVARRHGDDREHERGAPAPPRAEAVEQGQAHPHEVEGHGLPVVPADHDGQVDRREGAPAEVRPAPGDAGSGIRHGEPSR